MPHRKKVLSVGQCGFDHGTISRLLESEFDVQVTAADTHDAAMDLIGQVDFSLVLINRILDMDGTAGQTVLESIRSSDAATSPPVMLVSNFDDAQETAVKAGALRGFGKSDLATGKATEVIADVLGK